MKRKSRTHYYYNKIFKRIIFLNKNIKVQVWFVVNIKSNKKELTVRFNEVDDPEGGNNRAA